MFPSVWLSYARPPSLLRAHPSCTRTSFGLEVDYTVPENDPEGSISIFTRSDGYSKCVAGFERYNKPYRTRRLMDFGVRKAGMNFTSFSQDMEPEFIAISDNNRWAYVTLQASAHKNNAVAYDLDLRYVDVGANRRHLVFTKRLELEHKTRTV